VTVIYKEEEAIKTESLHINEFKEHFEPQQLLSVEDIDAFYRQYEPDLKHATLL
jgi:hypothetical protein